MDSIISAALEEICIRAASGIPVGDLWPSLKGALSAAGLPLSDVVCGAIWARLLLHPGLRFVASNGSLLDSGDPSVRSLVDAERIRVRILAEEHLRDSFLGIYDLRASSSEISETQRRALERLAAARTKGITQSELAKEFEKKGNYFFYVVRNLEWQQLIVRQPTIIWEKELGTDCDNAMRSNLIHLYRYAKNINLNSQQRFEITRIDALEDLENADGVSSHDRPSRSVLKDDVSIKDYLPAMKDVCYKLEEAREKTLPVREIKSVLGYTSKRGHREWRNILNRLKDAHLVEEIRLAENKDYLRLLKKFDFKDVHARKIMRKQDDPENEYLIKHEKRGHITDQLVELPLEHCIYDIIDAEGQKGIARPEVCKRLGWKCKKLDRRLNAMCERFRMPCHYEISEKTRVHRVWTYGNYMRYSTSTLCGKYESLPDENGQLVQLKHSASPDHWLDASQSKEELLSSGKIGNELVGLQPSNAGSGSLGDLQLIKDVVEPKNNAEELLNISGDPEVGCMEMLSDLDALQSKKCLSIPSIPLKKAIRRSSYFSLTIDGMKREDRIRQVLEREKFILKVELQKDLEQIEKDKGTRMDRKTLIRILNKMQEEGACKIYKIRIPVVTNITSSRLTEVILHPSVVFSHEIFEKIYERQRNFDALVRGKGSGGAKYLRPVSDLAISSNHVDSNATMKAMRANGYVPATMVRVKLLHKFIWCYISSLPEWHNALNSEKRPYDLKNPQSTCQLFALDKVVKEMPLQLFLQVVGSPKEIDNMVEHCRIGSRLSDIPLSEYKNLMNIPSVLRLSRVINILIRLKLIQLVRGLPVDIERIPHAVLTHSMELNPYIEEPLSLMRPSSHLNVDHHLRIRHDFELLKLEAVDAYWETLEYCYAAADKTAATDAFPGSSVHEVFHIRSWSSIRVMTAEQRMELLKRVTNSNSGKKISFQDCVGIARELNLTVEQVLRVSYDKRQSRLHSSGSSKSKNQGNSVDAHNFKPLARKRKRHSKDGFSEHAFDQNELVNFSRRKFSGRLAQRAHRNSLFAGKEHDCQVSDCRGHCNSSSAGDSWRKSTRSKRSIWTDTLDRELVMQYAIYRVTHGAKFFRVDWNSISGRPAAPAACCRRMTEFKKNQNFWTALMRLCNRLREQYDSFLEKTKSLKGNESLSQNLGSTCQATAESNSQHYSWNDFDHPDLKFALDEVLKYKRPAKFDRRKRFRSPRGTEWQDIPHSDGLSLDLQDSVGQKKQNAVSAGAGDKHHLMGQKVTTHGINRSNSDNPNGTYVEPLNRRYLIASRRLCQSLPVANAVELLKLVLLSSPSASQAQTSLAATMQLYSEHDIFAAYYYLKEKNFMVAGHGSRPFVLSRKFWHNVSSSPFPVDSGKRASDFSNWLIEQDDDLMVKRVDISSDLQCGDAFHLFALVSAGELSIYPCLPKDGIGEADELKNVETMSQLESDNCECSNITKRKRDSLHYVDVDRLKKPRTELKFDNDYSFRREKGFPGIKIVLSRESISKADAVRYPLRQQNHDVAFSCERNNQRVQGLNSDSIDQPVFSNLEQQSFSTNIMSALSLDELPWDAITSYAECLYSKLPSRDLVTLSPELMKSVHSAVCQAGELGLDLKDISKIMGMQGEQLAEVVVNTLEVYSLAIKVNSYDNFRVLDSVYKSKYFISTGAVHIQDPKELSFLKSRATKHGDSHNVLQEKPDNTYDTQGISTNLHPGHRITIVGLASEHAPPNTARYNNNASDVISEGSLLVPSCPDEGKAGQHQSLFDTGAITSYPILPWINADGSINTIVYKALIRRIIGIIMQHPGMVEEDIIRRMDALNPQSCRKLLELMILDNHLIVRMLQQTTSSAPPSILRNIFSCTVSKQEFVFRKHFFANPMRTNLL